MSNKPEPETNTALDFRGISRKDCKKADFPIAIGTEYRVHISTKAHQAMSAHAATTSEVELCGVLVGDVFHDSQGPFLKITAVIEGQGANNYGSQVTFTHDTWSHINKKKDELYPEQKIVGWYHTHPGFGVFLSNMDSFIQENFFNQPYQVAIVLETKQKVEGCFAWQNGKSVALERYWVGEREVRLATGEAKPFDPDTAGSDGAEPVVMSAADVAGYGTNYPEQPFNWSSIIMAALIFGIGLFAGMWHAAGRIRDEMTDSFLTEIYSALESAGLNTMAAEDFKDVGARLRKLRQAVGDTLPKAQAREWDDLLGIVDVREQEYRKRRVDFRAHVRELHLQRMNLSSRIFLLDRKLQQVSEDFYFMRLTVIIGRMGPVNPEQFPEEQRRMLKFSLDQVLQNSPQQKEKIRQMWPGLLEYYYPLKSGTGDGSHGGGSDSKAGAGTDKADRKTGE